MRESTFKRTLVEQANIKNGYRLLDLGCGTATLTILIKKAHPGTEVTGLDGDPKILGIARAKVAKEGLGIFLDTGMSFELPYPDSSFDRVVSSLVFHHLTTENKARTFKDIFKVLKPGGELHVADFGKPHNALMYLISLVFRHLEETRDNIDGCCQRCSGRLVLTGPKRPQDS
jgi:ubiquinone/menaquinone biosynthesis C-methylase UbiE